MDNVFISAEKALDTTARPSTKGQNAKSLEDVIVIPWNDLPILERTLRQYQGQIAAVITEPVLCNSGCIQPLPGYLETLRKMTAEEGIVLIFDEVITGFRLGLGGAQEYFGITPDLVTMGKAVAGGLPLSVVGGTKDIMSLIATGDVNHMGTLNGNPLCTASAIAAIDYLAQDNGRVYSHMQRLADMLAEGLRELANKYRFPMVVNQAGPVFHTMFTEAPSVTHYHQFLQRDTQLFAKFAEYMMEEGIAVRPSGLWYLSTAHSLEDIEQTLTCAERVFMKLRQL